MRSAPVEESTLTLRDERTQPEGQSSTSSILLPKSRSEPSSCFLPTLSGKSLSLSPNSVGGVHILLSIRDAQTVDKPKGLLLIAGDRIGVESQSSPDHLCVEGWVLRRSGQQYGLDKRHISALGKYPVVDEAWNLPRRKCIDDLPAFIRRRVSIDHHGSGNELSQ